MLHNKSFSEKLLSEILISAKEMGLMVCCDVIIFNDNKEIFIQKRSGQRKLYPNCWEVPGGHVEENESILETLSRELKEETDMTLIHIVDYIDSFDWQKQDGTKCRNFQFLAEAEGIPRIEANKSTEFRWIKKGEEEILLDNRAAGDTSHYEIIKKAFEILHKYV